MAMEYVDFLSTGQQTILCCQCGAATQPNPSNMCVACLRTQVDITEGIPKQVHVNFCKACERYLQPPDTWVSCALESRELLALCLKKLKGLSKVRLVDAGFIWTEPHSKRLKVKLTIQKEVMNATILQQVFVVEYVVQGQMCGDCHRREAKDYWKALVQIRQKTNHKKTFFYLEQLIIKHQAHNNTLRIKQQSDGLDFFFATPQDAKKFVSFLQSVAPLRSKLSQRLISHDVHTSSYNYSNTHSVELIPVCKDDVVCLPLKLARSLGNIGQLVICSRVTTGLKVLDPTTLKTAEISANIYWRTPFHSLLSYKQLTEFMVLQSEPVDHSQHTSTISQFCLADVWVTRTSEIGLNDAQYHCRTYLGHLLKAGDLVMGIDFTTSNLNDENLNKLAPDKIPDVILVKKVYGDKKERKKARKWKLKTLEKDMEGENLQQIERDYDDFLEDLEEDKTYRQNVNIYKDSSKAGVSSNTDDLPEVSLEEMLDDLNLDDVDM
ncbi:60S ribosomal export protein NMD3-like [Dendronephthya gigantea]|uniref:60S ribosomal export protein NMD3-like n=1 Tax=Dendronephthya gigantea TaxID=151771 RepID=UPI00106BABA9|nr:60S ribosomal export protein NMD3-like [Dendronephthya gigantea]